MNGLKDSILFIGGFLSFKEEYQNFSKLLATYDKRLIFISPPGHPGDKLNATSKEDWLKSFSEKYLEDPIDVIGYSLGGRILLELKNLYPKNIKNALIISSHPGLDDPNEKEIRVSSDQALKQKIIKEFSSKKKQIKFFNEWYSNPIFQNLKNSPDFNQYIIKKIDYLSPSVSKSLDYFSLGKQENFKDFIIDNQVKLIVGKDDPKFSELQLPKSTINDADHNPLFSHPQYIINYIMENF